MSKPSRLNYRTHYLRSTEVSYETLDYKSFYDVLSVVEEVLVVDLSKYATSLPLCVLEEAIPGPEGLYLKNSIEPVYSFVNPVDKNIRVGLVSAAQAKIDPTVCDILSYEDFCRMKEPVYRGDLVNKDGSLRLLCENPAFVSKMISPYPEMLYTGVNLLKIEVYRLLYRDSLCLPLTSLHQEELTEGSYLTAKGLNVYKENKPKEFQTVTEQVSRYSEKNKHNLITMKVRDCELIIEKGLDYRVVEYYREIFQHLDAIRLDEQGY